MVLYAAIALTVTFLIMLFMNMGKVKKVEKKEQSQIKQKVGLYAFGTIFSVGTAVFAFINGI